jgi:hypothetical protein
VYFVVKKLAVTILRIQNTRKNENAKFCHKKRYDCFCGIHLFSFARKDAKNQKEPNEHFLGISKNTILTTKDTKG